VAAIPATMSVLVSFVCDSLLHSVKDSASVHVKHTQSARREESGKETYYS
jgi:hypothetical protein